MILLILLAVLGLVGVVLTIVDIRRDGYRQVATDWTRVAERETPRDATPAISYR